MIWVHHGHNQFSLFCQALNSNVHDTAIALRGRGAMMRTLTQSEVRAITRSRRVTLHFPVLKTETSPQLSGVAAILIAFFLG
jgi:hypothetical protein